MPAKRCLLVALFSLLVATSCDQDDGLLGPGSIDPDVAAAAATITAGDMFRLIAHLASDEMAGRDTPSPGLEAAAGYVADEFAALGLQPGATTGTFIQRFPIEVEMLDTETGQTAIFTAAVPNVVAILPGSHPVLRDTYVVFSAHMDHIGVGTADASGDSIYNGADDDASGTAALIEVAEAFASLETAPSRSIIFLAVSGEEKGLLGSRYYVDHPTVPIESIVADVNADMISRNSPDSIAVMGQEYSSLGRLLRRVVTNHPEVQLFVAGDLWPGEDLFFGSDHFSFVRKGIPALWFFAGTHEDYHELSDEVETINTDKAARVARLIFFTMHEIANAAEAPTWTDTSFFDP
jgi:Zn-dependent M28 family amino/carboxypeptidase